MNYKYTSHNKRSLIGIIVLILIIVVTGGYLVFTHINIPLNKMSFKDVFKNVSNYSVKESRVIKEINYDFNINTQFESYNNYILKCIKDKIIFIDKKGNEVYSIPANISNPMVKKSGDYALVVDMGGKGICLLSGMQKKWEKKLETNILNADIGRNGNFVVVHEQNMHKGAVTFFSSSGFEQFTSVKAEKYVLSATVSYSGKDIAINMIDISGAKINAKIEFVDGFGKLLANYTPKEDSIFPLVRSAKKDYFFAVGDSMAICFDNDKKVRWQEAFNQKVYSSNILLNKYLLIATNKKSTPPNFLSNKIEIRMYSLNGKVTTLYELDNQVTDIETYDDLICINTGKKVYFVSKTGNLISEYTAEKRIDKVRFLSHNQAFIVIKGSVLIIDIR